MYILINLLAQTYKNNYSGEKSQTKIKRNLNKKNYQYITEDDVPPTYAECDKCERLYFNSIMCPNCQNVNTNILPNFTQSINKKSKIHFKCSLQSAEEETGTTETHAVNDVKTLVQSVDAEKGMEVSFVSPMEQLSSHLFSNDADLSKFLTRPVLIKSYTWAEGGGLLDTFSPWLEYLNQPIIKNKIQNYYTGRMNLHLKIMTNASPFYYGAALITYRPNAGFASGELNTGDNTFVNGLSQRPHIWVYPQTSQGGEMHLPFIYHLDAVDLTSSGEVSALGEIVVKSVTTLENANSVSTTGCTVRIYAYASEINLGGPTYKAVLQSKDEYGNGPVSGVASAVANISRSLESVPVIGRFAKATTIGASAISSVASLFGFTDVPVINNVEPMKNLPFHSLASAHIGEPVTKLCLDPKNEVTIDNSVIGVGVEDELNISNFVGRYAYIGQANWTAASTPDSLLWCQVVQPNVFNTSAAAPGPYNSLAVQATPVGHVAQLFKYWRGSMTYKITAIASKFHRGRYVITWDPCANISDNRSYIGTSFTKIVDIAEESEIEITIPYKQPQPFCISNTYADSQLESFGSTYRPHDPKYSNGVFTIRVFTQQTSPVATADIQLLISVKGGDDLEFAMPRELSQRISPFAYQSYVELQSDVTYDSRTTMNITNEECKSDPERYLVSFGEPIKSLRLLLRRATLYSCDIIPSETTPSNVLVNYLAWRSVYPISPGFDPNGVHAARKGDASGFMNYNYVYMTPLAFITQCFTARRGSIIHHLNMNSGTTADGYLAASFNPTTRSRTQWNSGTEITNVSQTVSSCTSQAMSMYDQGCAGTDMTTGYVMPALSVSVPFNTPAKYCTTNPKFAVVGAGGDYTNLMTLKLQYTTRDNSLAQIVDYVQIGTDYSVGMFINVPTMYVASSIPPPFV